jgi:hypothetical protein
MSKFEKIIWVAILLLLIVWSGTGQSQEVISSFQEENLPVLNDELHRIENRIDSQWPVGSVFISTVSTNPATLLGFGKWESFGAGKVIVGIDSTQSIFDTVLETGGVYEVTLGSTQSGLPAHTHIIDTELDESGTGYITEGAVQGGAPGNDLSTQANAAANAVSPHTNIQPFIVCYMWRRTG